MNGTHNQSGSWDRMAEEMKDNFFRSGRPIFRASRAFRTGELRSKGGRKKSIHFNGSNENIELLLRTVISANQLSIHGAIANLCDEAPKRIRVPVKSAAPKHLEEVEITTPMNSSGETTARTQNKNSSNCRKTRGHQKCALMRV